MFNELEEQINELLFEQDNLLAPYEKVIEILLENTAKLKDYALKAGFKNQQEEILFFKQINPKFIAKLIYYNAVYKIETKKPQGAKAVKKYLNEELNKLKRYFDNNLEFYKYYGTNNTFIDDKLFVRNKYDIKLSLDTFCFEADRSFSTSHDYKVAKIIANDLIQVYIEDQLYNKNYKKELDKATLNWTRSKTALIELIYALLIQGVFDNGNADIKLIAKTFETAFNIDLGDFYHTFMDLKAQKINRTKFLDSLCEAMIKKMDEQDEK